MVLSKLKKEASSTTVLVALIAAAAPLTAGAVSLGTVGVQWSRNQTELELAQRKQDHEIRMAFLKHYNEAQTYNQRRSVLSLARADMFKDYGLSSWAADELRLLTRFQHLCTDLCNEKDVLPLDEYPQVQACIEVCLGERIAGRPSAVPSP